MAPTTATQETGAPPLAWQKSNKNGPDFAVNSLKRAQLLTMPIIRIYNDSGRQFFVLRSGAFR
jgi:hypothetical protein